MSSKTLYTCKKCGKEFKRQEMTKNLDQCCTCAKIEHNLLNIKILHKEKRRIDTNIFNLRQEISELQETATS